MADDRDYGIPQTADSVEILKDLECQEKDIISGEGAPEMFPKGTRMGVLDVYKDRKEVLVEIYDQDDFQWNVLYYLPFSDVKVVYRPFENSK